MAFTLPGGQRTPSRDGFWIQRRTRRRVVVALAAFLGPLTGASPLGSAVGDALWCAALAGAGAYLGTASKRGPLLFVAFAALVSARTAPAGAYAVVAVLSAAFSTRHLRRRAVLARGSAGGAAVLALMADGGELSWWHLALATGAIGGTLLVSGIRNMSSAHRRVWRLALVLTGVGVGLAVLFVGVGVGGSAHDLREGAQQLRLGLAAARQGDVEGATARLEAARTRFDQGRKTLLLWGAPARVVPGLAPQVDAVVEVLARVEDATVQSRRVTEALSDGRLAADSGRVDLDLLRSLQIPLARVERSLRHVVEEVDSHESQALLPPLRDRLHELRADSARAHADSQRAAGAARILPEVLGGSEERRYLAVFATPAEARGRFGFPGSFAEVTFSNGRMELGERGSTSELLSGLEFDQHRFDLGDPMLRPYVPYGATRLFNAATISPDFPTVAEVMAEMWRQSGRKRLDGIVRLDPSSIAGLMTFTGPVAVEGRSEPLTAQTVERFLLVDQYVEFPKGTAAGQAPRRELLDDIADATFERLENADLPAPRALVTRFAPLAADQHLQVWMRDPTAQRLMAQTGVAGELPRPASDSLAVLTVNGLGNKIDTFLTTSIEYRGSVREGRLEATATVTLANGAPSTGLPDYVIGSFARPAPPRGTNRSTVFVYTSVPAESITVDGRTQHVESTLVAGRWLHELVVDLPPRGQATVELELAGDLPEERYRLDLVPSGGVRATTIDVAIRVEGRDLRRTGPLHTPSTLR
jgi:hypothetical protein